MALGDLATGAMVLGVRVFLVGPVCHRVRSGSD